MNSRRVAGRFIAIALVVLLHRTALAQERPTLLVGHGTLSGSILPLWVGADAKLFDKHGIQVRPIYLPRAAGRRCWPARSRFTIPPDRRWCRCA